MAISRRRGGGFLGLAIAFALGWLFGNSKTGKNLASQVMKPKADDKTTT